MKTKSFDARDRKIDALIQTHVFKTKNVRCATEAGYSYNKGENFVYPNPYAGKLRAVAMVRRFTTEIHVAWAVVEQMQKRGWKFCIADMRREIGWRAEFKSKRDGRFFLGDDKGAPRAICLAALAALKVRI